MKYSLYTGYPSLESMGTVIKKTHTTRFLASRMVMRADAEPRFVVETPQMLENGIIKMMAID